MVQWIGALGARAARAAEDGAGAALDDVTLFELKRALSRMGVVITMVQTRMPTLGDARFGAFVELMDIYESACRAQLDKGVDFRANAIDLSDQQRTEVNVLVRRLFGLE